MDEIRPIRGKAPGDQYSDWLDANQSAEMKNAPVVVATNPLDSEEAQRELRMLLGWYYLEREKQAANRLEMALDADFYDGLQWDPEDAAIVKDRGQMPLVYNEIAPMVDWLIGTERRTRADWKVLPRAEDDVDMADVKTKVLKYVSDINRVPFERSRAFADAVKSGLGWVDDGARDDPTQDILYSKYEDWRNVLHDSSGYDLDLTDSRYLFRWRWVDEDVALMMFPDRADKVRMAVEDAGAFSLEPEEDTWYLGEKIREKSGTIFAAGSGLAIDAKRRRVKLIEAQYRMPVKVQLIGSGQFRGEFFNPNDPLSVERVQATGASIVDRIMMRVHFSVFTESALLSRAVSQFRHNRFGLTPLWCYRRSRDRLPYGAIRRCRDIQQDINKRASKALFMLNTNQIIMDEGAVEDPNVTRDEADRPDGMIVKRPGKELLIRRDTEAAAGQVEMMTLGAQSIQKTAGINNENLGRQTNAVSGAAIQARQTQGAVGTTEPFDNLRLAIQAQGEKQLSLVEQFYTEEKVIRITGSQGAIEWVKVNQPEMQADGSVRYLNDITASQCDFIVSEQDFAGTLRQVMFESLSQIAGTLPPEVSLRVLRMAFEFSDLPNKREIVEEIRKITGERDPNKKLTPEEAQQVEEQMREQAEAMQLQREQAMLVLEEARAKVRKLNAEADKAIAEAQAGDGGSAEVESAIRQVQSQAADQIDALQEALRKAQTDLANKSMQIRSDADSSIETARISADAQIRVAEINRRASDMLDALNRRMDDITDKLQQSIDKAREEAKQGTKAVEDKIKEAPPAPAEKAEPAPAAPVTPPPQPITLNVAIDAKAGTVKKTMKFETDAAGNIVGGTSVEEEGK